MQQLQKRSSDDDVGLAKKMKFDQRRRTWYENLPQDSDLDDSLFSKPLDTIVQSILNELEILDIDIIVQQYTLVLSEFYELSESYRLRKPRYNEIFEKFVKTICEIYDIRREPMVIYPNKYTTREWGNVYWDFLHLSSILLSYAFETGKIDTLLNFSTLVYNVDCILPCPKCEAHYAAIKNKPELKQIIKVMNFGSVMISLQIFHNVITDNIDKTPDYANMPNRDRFLVADFALKYKCIDVQDEIIKRSSTYSKSHIDWQPVAHVLLSIILSAYCSQPSYDRASNLLKIKLYSTIRPNVVKVSSKFEIRCIDKSDMIYASLTTKQVKYCLMRALLLQFQDTELDREEIEKNKRLNYAILKIYTDFKDEIKQLATACFNRPEELAEKNNVLSKLDQIPDVSG